MKKNKNGNIRIINEIRPSLLIRIIYGRIVAISLENIEIYPPSSNELTFFTGSSTSGLSPISGHHRIGCNVASLFIQASRTIHSLPWNDTTRTTTTTTMPHYRNWTTRFHRRRESVYRGADWPPPPSVRNTCYLLTKRLDYAFSKVVERKGRGGRGMKPGIFWKLVPSFAR